MSLAIDTRQTPVTATLSGELSVITLGICRMICSVCSISRC